MRSEEPGEPVALAVPSIGAGELASVRDSLLAGWVSSAGPDIAEFEREVAAYVGAAHAVATSSGTAALHVALLLAGVAAGDEAVVPSLTFVAPANAVRYVGAWPVFVDVEPEFWQLDPAALRQFLTEDCEAAEGGVRNRRTGRPVRAVLPVHLLGHPCDLDSISELAEEFGLAVVQDAAESLGAGYKGARVGGLGGVAGLSFNGNKIMTTGGGGMVTTDDAAQAARARYLTTQARDDPLEYVHHAIGFNYRLTNLQAAFGRAQLARLPEFVAAKRRIAWRYASAFADLDGVEMMAEAPWARATFWLATVTVDPDVAGRSARQLLAHLREQGIETRPLWQPLHLSPAHGESYARPCPVAEWVNARALSLPCSTGLHEEDQERVIAAVVEACG